jgi:hypothetical protein
MSAISGVGSMAPVFVVPALDTTRNGRKPRRRSAAIAASSASGRMRRRTSTSIQCTLLSGNPAKSADLAMQWCASRDA